MLGVLLTRWQLFWLEATFWAGKIAGRAPGLLWAPLPRGADAWGAFAYTFWHNYRRSFEYRLWGAVKSIRYW